MADTYCTDCNRSTEVVFDHSSGDTICSECGLVIEAHFIDETSEWRTFANDSNNNDPIRVGGPTNPLLDDVALSTIISKPIISKPTDHLLSSSLGRWQIRNNTSLITAFHTIDTMSDRLGLVAIIKDRACEIYKKMEDLKSIGGKNRDAMSAACLYVSCRQEDKPRTMKEIASVANGATRKEIGRAKEYIVKHLGAENVGQAMEMGTIHAVDFMRRFCSNLQMTSQEIKASQEVVKKSEAFDIRRSPISVAAAVIYMISQLSDHKKLIKDISIATGVAEGTIRNTYKDLYPYASRLIPSSFAREEDLKNLCSPCAER